MDKLKADAIQAVTFDVGGTLIEAWPSVGHVYAEVAERHGYGRLPPEALTRQFQLAWQRKGEFDYSTRAWRWIVEQTFAGCTPKPVNDALFEALCARFIEPDAWRVYDDVWPALRALRKRGFKLGIISNWDERLRPLLDGLDLTRWFDAIVVSIEVGVTKPAPGIFERAAKALEVPSSAILHVGDSQREDVEGARAAGLQAVQVNRKPRDEAPGNIRDLRQIAWQLDCGPEALC